MRRGNAMRGVVYGVIVMAAASGVLGGVLHRSLDSHHGLWPWARSGFRAIPRPAASGSSPRDGARSAARPAIDALRDYGALPDFLLTDHRQQPINRAQLSGSVWIADFIFTRCAGQCPMMSAQLATLQQAFRGVPGIQFVSFTVDPEHDTPEILAEYAKPYAADAHSWRLVTGSKEALYTLAQAGFHLGVGEEGSPVEPITHSVRFVLVDQAGHIRGYYDATDAEAMRRLEEDVRQLLANN